MKKANFLLILIFLIMLRQGFSQQIPEIFVQNCHTEIDGIYLSPNEKTILSYGDDEFKIWDFETGKLLAFNSVGKVDQVFWENNSSVAFTQSVDKQKKEIKEWDFHQDKISLLKGTSQNIPIGLVQSEDACYHASINLSDQLLNTNEVSFVIKDLNGQIKKQIIGRHQNFYFIHGFSEENRLLVTEGKATNGNRTIYVWDTLNYNLVNRIELPNSPNFTIHDKFATLDCKYIVCTGKLSSNESILLIYNTLTGDRYLSKKFDRGKHINISHPIQYDNILLTTNNFDNKPSIIRLLNLDTKKFTTLMRLPHPTRFCQITKNRKYLLVGSSLSSTTNHSLARYELSSGTKVLSYGEKLLNTSGIFCNRIDENFILDIDESKVQKWSILQGKPIHQYFVDSENSRQQGFVFADEGTHIVQYSNNRTKIKNIDTGKLLKAISGPKIDRFTRTTKVSSNKKFIITGDGFKPARFGFFQDTRLTNKYFISQSAVTLWESNSSSKNVGLAYGVPSYKVDFSTDSKYCMATLGNRMIIENDVNRLNEMLKNYTIKIWLTQTGEQVFQKNASVFWKQNKASWISPVAVYKLSENNSKLAYVSMEGDESFLSIIEVSTNSLILRKELNLNFLDCAVSPASLAFNGAGTQLILATTASPPYLRLFDINSGEVVHVFEEQTAPVKRGGNCVKYAYKDNYIITAGQDNKIRIYDIKNKNLLVSSAIFDDANWITWAENGYFNGSVEASEYVSWRYKNEIYSFNQFNVAFYKPEIISDILEKKFLLSARETLPKIPTIKIVKPNDRDILSISDCYVNVVAEDDIEVQDVQVFLNQRPLIKTNEKNSLNTNIVSLNQRVTSGYISLAKGMNVIKAIAFDNEGNQSTPISMRVRCNKEMNQLPKIAVISIGVSDYKNQLIDLPCAISDANSVGTYFAEQKGLIYQNTYNKILLDKEATNINIIKTLKEIPPLSIDDVVVIFISGHGIKDEKETFYFCSYGTDTLNIENSALKWQMFENIVADLNAGKVVLFLDTCHSGDILGKVSGDKFAEGIAKNSAIVFTSCKGVEKSIEDKNIGHGLFTYCLLEALKGKADYPADGKITMLELLNYVSSEVPKMARKYHRFQTPFTPRLENFADFYIAAIE